MYNLYIRKVKGYKYYQKSGCW